MTNEFVKSFQAYLFDTTCYNNCSYLAYFQWAAITKESFLISKVKNFTSFFNKKGIKLLVLESSIKINKEVKLHDKIKIKMSCRSLKKLKAELFYEILSNDNIPIASTVDKIVFLNKDNKIIEIPDSIFNAFSSILTKQ